jgi:hypothetical protein
MLGIVLLNLFLIVITGGWWLFILIVWAIVKFLFGKK